MSARSQFREAQREARKFGGKAVWHVTDIDGVQHELICTCEYYAAEKRTRDYPGSPAYWDVVKAVDLLGKDRVVELSSEDREAIDAAVWATFDPNH